MVQQVTGTQYEVQAGLPQPRADFRATFDALPLKVICRHIAEQRILRICPTIEAEWLALLPITQLERVYRRRMNARKADSGTKTYVVETAEEIPSRLAELKVMFAELQPSPLIPDSRIELDVSREYAEASA